MKKTLVYMGGFVLSFLTLTSNAQENWDAKKNPTVDSIAALYRDKIVTAPAPPTREDIFPAIGHYSVTSASTSLSLTITVDEENKGIAWVEGLPQGRIKAMLRKSPATYKIPAQTTAEGNAVAEGTLIYDKTSNTLRICLGKNYDAADPSAAFNVEETEPAETVKGKNKKPVVPKTMVYTGSKQTGETVKN